MLEDLLRLYQFLADEDVAAAKQAQIAIQKALGVLTDMPFIGRMVDRKHPDEGARYSFWFKECVALYKIETHKLVTVHAFRH